MSVLVIMIPLRGSATLLLLHLLHLLLLLLQLGGELGHLVLQLSLVPLHLTLQHHKVCTGILLVVSVSS